MGFGFANWWLHELGNGQQLPEWLSQHMGMTTRLSRSRSKQIGTDQVPGNNMGNLGAYPYLTQDIHIVHMTRLSFFSAFHNFFSASFHTRTFSCWCMISGYIVCHYYILFLLKSSKETEWSSARSWHSSENSTQTIYTVCFIKLLLRNRMEGIQAKRYCRATQERHGGNRKGGSDKGHLVWGSPQGTRLLGPSIPSGAFFPVGISFHPSPFSTSQEFLKILSPLTICHWFYFSTTAPWHLEAVKWAGDWDCGVDKKLLWYLDPRTLAWVGITHLLIPFFMILILIVWWQSILPETGEWPTTKSSHLEEAIKH